MTYGFAMCLNDGYANSEQYQSDGKPTHPEIHEHSLKTWPKPKPFLVEQPGDSGAQPREFFPDFLDIKNNLE